LQGIWPKSTNRPAITTPKTGRAALVQGGILTHHQALLIAMELKKAKESAGLA
jgi:hypothetical protein